MDNQAPIITLLGDSNITHEAGTAYIDAGANWNDAVDGNGTADANGTVDENVPGIYTIIYSFTDSSGNAAQSITRTIEVVDTTPPVISSNRRCQCHPPRIHHLYRSGSELDRPGRWQWKH